MSVKKSRLSWTTLLTSKKINSSSVMLIRWLTRTIMRIQNVLWESISSQCSCALSRGLMRFSIVYVNSSFKEYLLCAFTILNMLKINIHCANSLTSSAYTNTCKHCLINDANKENHIWSNVQEWLISTFSIFTDHASKILSFQNSTLRKSIWALTIA